MSVLVRVTPQGHKIITQAVAAVITDDGGFAKVTFASHGFTTGDVIYIDSDIEEYNGFVTVGVDDANSFFISGDFAFIPYYQSADINYYQTSDHEWSSIFLPIVYKLSNNRWPVNSIDTAAQNVSAYLDDNGYTRIQFSSDLRSSPVRALEYIKLTGSNFDGVYQIVEMISQQDIVVNLAYDASISGGQIQYYYNNYQISVRVYAGLNASHPMEQYKPYEILATLSFTPEELDGLNIIMFSVSEIIKSKVQVKNNLKLFSLPLNLDAFTQFKIAFAESYDYSDGYAIYRHEDDYTEDTFEGYAITAQLPFKNINSGWMSDYVFVSGEPAAWLTNQTTMLGVAGYYFDISFIKNVPGDFNLIIKKYISDDYYITESLPFEDKGEGVYRVPIELDSTYERFCVYIQIAGSSGSELQPLAEWETEGGSLQLMDDWDGVANGWTWDDGKWKITSNSGGTEILNAVFFGFQDQTYDFNIQVDLPAAGSSLTSEWTYALLDAGDNVLDSIMIPHDAFGPDLDSFSLTATGAVPVKFRISAMNTTPVDSKNFWVTGAELVQNTAWTTGANPDVDLQSSQDSADLKGEFNSFAGTEYTATLDFDVSAGPVDVTVKLRSGVTVLDSDTQTFATGNHVATFTLEGASDGDLLAVSVENDSGSLSVTDINSVEIEGGGGEAYTLTDEICIDIVAPCDVPGYVPDENIRLTEDGDFRILE